MWRNVNPVVPAIIRSVEKEFSFQIDDTMRVFLADHNGGSPSPGTFPTTVRFRKLANLLDFASQEPAQGVWRVNDRMRNEIGNDRLIIGVDENRNYLCLQKEQRKQKLVLWLHTSNEFADCLWDIPAFIRNMT